MRVPCMYVCTNDKYHAGSWLTSTLLSIMTVHEVSCWWVLSVWWRSTTQLEEGPRQTRFTHGETGVTLTSPKPLFDLPISKSPMHSSERVILASGRVCDRHVSSNWRRVWNSAAENTFPCLRCLPVKSFVVLYSKPFQYHPVHAVVLLLHGE